MAPGHADHAALPQGGLGRRSDGGGQARSCDTHDMRAKTDPDDAVDRCKMRWRSAEKEVEHSIEASP